MTYCRITERLGLGEILKPICPKFTVQILITSSSSLCHHNHVWCNEVSQAEWLLYTTPTQLGALCTHSGTFKGKERDFGTFSQEGSLNLVTLCQHYVQDVICPIYGGESWADLADLQHNKCQFQHQ